MAGTLPRPEGTDDDEAWRMGWTSGTERSKGAKGAVAAGTGDDSVEEGSETTSWPAPVVAAAIQPAVLPGPIFPNLVASSAASVPPTAPMGTAVPLAAAAVPTAESTAPSRLSAAALDAGVVPRKPGGPAMRVYLFMVNLMIFNL